MKTELTLSDGTTMAALPCAHCGSGDLFITTWCGDSGDSDAVACRVCESESPVERWNQRAFVPHVHQKEASQSG